MGNLERGFALLGIVILVSSIMTIAVVPTTATQTENISFDSPVPREYSFNPSPPTTSGTVQIGDQTFDSLHDALRAASNGDTLVLSGRFDGQYVVNVSNVTITSSPEPMAYINGTGKGNVLTLKKQNITVNRVWVANSGYDPSGNDAAIWVESQGARIVNSRVTEMTFGIWVNGVDDVLIRNNTIVGRERVTPLSYRGNGIQLWKTSGTEVYGNRITDVRDGVYYSWASHTDVRRNIMWDLRYGVHYMYSDHNWLVNNLAFNNDCGYALMVSQHLHILNNTAVNNYGKSGHGIMVKSIDHSIISNNTLVNNHKGLYVYNSYDNNITSDLLLDNDIGIHLTAGSFKERVYGNSFIANDRAVVAVTSTVQVKWNASWKEYGNYWSSAPVTDPDNDGISEIRYRPGGLVQFLTQQHPQTIVFTASPAFDAIRMAESSFPVIHSPGIVDMHPLTNPPHNDWRRFYRNTSSERPPKGFYHNLPKKFYSNTSTRQPSKEKNV